MGQRRVTNERGFRKKRSAITSKIKRGWERGRIRIEEDK